MQKLNSETQKIMFERFGRDSVIALATLENGMPSVRNVNAYYEDGAFYIITYALSNKMKQIEENPKVAIAGDWFTAHGTGTNLGYFYKEENLDIAEKLKKVFSAWIDNGHNNFDDENTCILCIKLIDGVLFSHGKRYDIDFTANRIPSYCGLDCEQCEHRKQFNCTGCIASDGQSFCFSKGDTKCEIAFCVKNKGIQFCGECGDFPCEILKQYSFDKEHGDDGIRIENCRTLKKELVADARAGIDPVSICGHHCDFCFLGEWCGSCRSTYNCCSYATLFEDKRCPNVVCSDQKRLDGCYACPELESCEKGFYGLKDQYAAKATALFIKKYGNAMYTETLKKAIEQGLKYADSLDAAGSAPAALELLEKYISPESLT